jgi:uncharacterized membrane protein
MHPLAVHFPVALLAVAPLFIVIGLLVFRSRATFFACALVLMILGTGSAYLAVATGEAAEDLVEETPLLEEAVHEHEELAEKARNVFTALTLAFAGVVLIPAIRRRPGGAAWTAVTTVFLLSYAGALVLLANTAHHGGLLVHQHGVHAPLASGSSGPADSHARGGHEQEDE